MLAGWFVPRVLQNCGYIVPLGYLKMFELCVVSVEKLSLTDSKTEAQPLNFNTDPTLYNIND